MIVNLTPHILTIYNEAQELVVTVPPSGTVARVSSEREVIGNVDGVTLYRTKYGNVVDGPPSPRRDDLRCEFDGAASVVASRPVLARRIDP